MTLWPSRVIVGMWSFVQHIWHVRFSTLDKVWHPGLSLPLSDGLFDRLGRTKSISLLLTRISLSKVDKMCSQLSFSPELKSDKLFVISTYLFLSNSTKTFDKLLEWYSDCSIPCSKLKYWVPSWGSWSWQEICWFSAHPLTLATECTS